VQALALDFGKERRYGLAVVKSGVLHTKDSWSNSHHSNPWRRKRRSTGL